MKAIFLLGVVVIGSALVACGGGSGVGPQELLKQEQQLRDRLPIDWSNYNGGDYEGAIDFFTSTLEKAETYEGPESILNEIKSEAHNGIGWAFFRMQSLEDRKSTRLNSSHSQQSRMPSSA